MTITKESGASDSQSGAQTENTANQVDNQDDSSENQDSKKTVSLEKYEADLKDARRFKDDMLKFKDENESLKTENQSIKDAKLKEDGNWKALAEQAETRAKALEGENKDLKKGYFDDRKFSEVRTLAAKAGLITEAEGDLELIDLGAIQVERTDQGRTLVHGAETFVENLKRTKPHWFKSGTNLKINSGGGGAPPPADPTELTAAYMVKLERTDKEKYLKVFPEYQRQRKERRN